MKFPFYCSCNELGWLSQYYDWLQAGWWVWFWQGQIFFSATMCRPDLGPTQPTLFLVVKELEHEADHTTSCSAKVKSAWSNIPTLPYVFMVLCLSSGTTLPVYGTWQCIITESRERCCTTCLQLGNLNCGLLWIQFSCLATYQFLLAQEMTRNSSWLSPLGSHRLRIDQWLLSKCLNKNYIWLWSIPHPIKWHQNHAVGCVWSQYV
jgi:hypothetical protein